MNCACSITTITFVSASTSRDLSIYSIKGYDDSLIFYRYLSRCLFIYLLS